MTDRGQEWWEDEWRRREAALAAREAAAALDQERLEALVSRVVLETLTRLGIDAENPMTMQRDFRHLREWRTTMEAVKAKGILAVVSIAVSGLVAVLWLGLKETLVKH